MTSPNSNASENCADADERTAASQRIGGPMARRHMGGCERRRAPLGRRPHLPAAIGVERRNGRPLGALEPRSCPAGLDRPGIASVISPRQFPAHAGPAIEVTYWRERSREMDFVLQRGADCVAIGLKGGRRKESLPGTTEFAKRFAPKKILLVGGQGI